MRVKLVSVGTRMPAWVKQGVDEYARRIRQDLGFELVEVPLSTRGKSSNASQFRAKEAKAILSKVRDDDFVVALEVTGSTLSTEALAGKLEDFRSQARNLCLLIGGPDGLDAACLDRADASWSLSALTMPHTIARIVIVEQLYRASSLVRGHPYHRA